MSAPSGIGGWTFQLLEGDLRRYPIEAGVSNNTTANRLTLHALIGGLEQLAENRRLAERPVEIVTDSEYLVDGVARLFPASDRRRWYRSDGQPIMNMDLWRQVACRLGNYRYSIRCLQGCRTQQGPQQECGPEDSHPHPQGPPW